MIIKFLTLLILFFFTTNKAFAYLDPGSVSILMQAIIFIAASVITFFGFIKLKIKNIFQKIFKKKNKNID
tara:strand:+ start:587 stop:796 length:210 start_codon:yes stop_codon:yes gene_type:complete